MKKKRIIKAWAVVIEADDDEWIIPQASTEETPHSLEIHLNKTSAFLKKQKGEKVVPCIVSYYFPSNLTLKIRSSN